MGRIRKSGSFFHTYLSELPKVATLQLESLPPLVKLKLFALRHGALSPNRQHCIMTHEEESSCARLEGDIES